VKNDICYSYPLSRLVIYESPGLIVFCVPCKSSYFQIGWSDLAVVETMEREKSEPSGRDPDLKGNPLSNSLPKLPKLV
jgi:hypothetical protein